MRVSLLALGAKSVRPKGQRAAFAAFVAYVIDAKYDPDKHSVDATETLTYHNLTGQPLDRFPFHLYLNGFQPKATWVHEAHRDGNFRTNHLRGRMGSQRQRLQRGHLAGSRRHGRPDQADEVHLSRRRQS